MDKKVIIATHGNLADGFVSALKIIVGELPQLEALCCYTTPDFDLDQTIENIMKNHDFENNELIVCTDMMGGSVNNGFTKYLGQYPFQLIANTNLALLVDLLLTPGEISYDKLLEKSNDELFKVKHINSLMSHFECDDDDL